MVNTKTLDFFEINNFDSQHFFRIGGKIEFLIFIKTILINNRKDITLMKK